MTSTSSFEPARTSPSARLDVLVVGAGFAGLYAVHRARAAGLRVAGVEAAPTVGGTWYWNRYPGARCDVESVDYSYSFDPELQQEWVWSERFAAQPEILRYLEHVADRFDLRSHFTFGQRVEQARFDDATATWQVSTVEGGRFEARHVIAATGCLSAPNKPAIRGLDDYAGQVLFTAQWPSDGVDLAGKRVGVIGTGSSGIQSIPIFAERAAAVTVFQRTANYSIPVPNQAWTQADQARIRSEYPARRAKSYYAPAASPHEPHPKRTFEVDEQERLAAYEARWAQGGVLFSKTFPDQLTDLAANDLAREFVEAKIRAEIDDPDVAEDLIPNDHPIGAKRICTDDGYFRTYNRDNVTLVNLRREPIDTFTAGGVKTVDRSFELDTLVFATGFDAMTGSLLRMNVRGARGSELAEEWADGPRTFLGMAIPGFPNFHVLSGPGSPSVMANMVLHAEQQVEWVIDLISAADARGADEVEARYDAATKWTDHVAEVADRTLGARADTWYSGANIEGKKRVYMPYVGGFGSYRTQCDEVRDCGFEGFVFTTGRTNDFRRYR